MYKIYVDKNEDFECEISVKNATLKNSIARIIIESEGVNFVFNGKIDGQKCVVPIKRLKGFLDENTTGKMHLEVIVEDTYFKPWESNFIVEEHTSVKVRVDEQKYSNNKPIVEVKSVMKSIKEIKSTPTKKLKSINPFVPKKEIASICEKFGIRKSNLKKKHNDVTQILKEYFNSNPEYKNHMRVILSGIGDFLR